MLDVRRLDERDALPYQAGGFCIVRASAVLLGTVPELLRVLDPRGALLLPSTIDGDVIKAVQCRGLSIDFRAISLPAPVPGERPWLVARWPLPPHDHGRDEHGERLRYLVRTAAPAQVTYVIPVLDEAPRLPPFIGSLKRATNHLWSDRRFVFVTNGCTDGSEDVIDAAMARSHLSWRRVSSEVGIVAAMRRGSSARRSGDWVGKLDADIVLDPTTLDRLEATLATRPAAIATYAEPIPIDVPNLYNRVDHEPWILSRRLFLTSKAALFRQDLLNDFHHSRALSYAAAEDIYLSFYLVATQGFDAITRGDGAVVHAKGIRSFADMIAQESRSGSEVARVIERDPRFALLAPALEQQVYDVQYDDLLRRARQASGYVENWTRIASTK